MASFSNKSHIVALSLFAVAGILYVFGSAGATGALVGGFAVEIAAWVVLFFSGNDPE